MISAEKLKELHESGKLESIHRLKYYRTAIESYCELRVPRGVSELDGWYGDNKSVITRKLNEIVDDEQSKEISAGTNSNSTGDNES